MCVLLVIAGCASPRDLELGIDRVDPGVGRSNADVRIRIEGTFHLPLRSDLDGTTLAAGRLAVTLDDVEATDVVWHGEQLIEATVPAGIAAGPHDVTVHLGEERAVLPASYLVLGDAARLVFTTPPMSVSACTCTAAIDLEVRDAADQRVTVMTPTLVSLGADTPGVTFYPDATCSTAVTQVSIEPGGSSAQLAFEATTMGTPTITASSPALASASQLELVSGSPPQWFVDADGDGFGDSTMTSFACDRPAGQVSVGGDCDDAPGACGAGCYPGNPAPDVCDGRDQDCSAATADGVGDPQLGVACDGADLDQCREGTLGCTTGTLVCSDVTASSVEGPAGSARCTDMIDNDCDGRTDLADPGCATCVPAGCLAAGGSCIGTTCVIVATGATRVNCPPGMGCQVRCETAGSCEQGVSCGTASSCDVRCIGAGACRSGGVDCSGAELCDVRCEGTAACEHGSASTSVNCRRSTCSVTCTGTDACEDGIAASTGGTCTAHCCNGGCAGGTATCTTDNVCM